MPPATATKKKTTKSKSKSKKASRAKQTAARAKTKSASRSGGGGRKRLMTPEDLLCFVFVGDPVISPDGSQVAFVRKHIGEKNNYVTTIWRASADGKGAPQPLTTDGGTGKAKDRSPRWSPDGSRLAFVREVEKGRSQIAVLDLEAGGEARILTDLPEGAIGDVRWSPAGDRLGLAFRPTASAWTKKAVEERKEKGLSDPPREIDDWWYRLDGDGYFIGQRYALLLVDAASGEHRELYAKDRLGFFAFDFSPDGKKIAIATNRDPKALIRPWKDEILIIDPKSGKAKPLADLPAGPKDAVAWSPDGAHIAFAGREGKDAIYSVENLELWVADAKKGGARSLTGDTDECLMAITLSDTAEATFAPKIRWTGDSKRLVVKFGKHGESHVASIPAKGGAITRHTSGKHDIDLGGVASRTNRAAIVRTNAASLPEVGVLDLNAKQVTMLTAFNRTLEREVALAPITEHWIPTADNTRVHTWVMHPPDGAPKRGRKRPAVLEIHGGPHAQYGVGFFHEFQCLAAQGYVVVFSNPRGSKGYGRDHCAAIRGNWGGADWIDIQAVTQFMQEHPDIDAKRMGIMGGSYGGYMTNWAIGHTRVFAGAITDRCVSNLVSMGGNSDFVDEPDRYFPGNFWDRPEARWNQSPMKYIGNAKTPTLIIHSEGDLRCNVEQAEQVFSALKLLNVPTRFVRYPQSTSHGMSRGGPPDLRIHRLHEILDWWAKYLNSSKSGARRRAK